MAESSEPLKKVWQIMVLVIVALIILSVLSPYLWVAALAIGIGVVALIAVLTIHVLYKRSKFF